MNFERIVEFERIFMRMENIFENRMIISNSVNLRHSGYDENQED